MKPEYIAVIVSFFLPLMGRSIVRDIYDTDFERYLVNIGNKLLFSLLKCLTILAPIVLLIGMFVFIFNSLIVPEVANPEVKAHFNIENNQKVFSVRTVRKPSRIEFVTRVNSKEIKPYSINKAGDAYYWIDDDVKTVQFITKIKFKIADIRKENIYSFANVYEAREQTKSGDLVKKLPLDNSFLNLNEVGLKDSNYLVAVVRNSVKVPTRSEIQKQDWNDYYSILPTISIIVLMIFALFGTWYMVFKRKNNVDFLVSKKGKYHRVLKVFSGSKLLTESEKQPKYTLKNKKSTKILNEYNVVSFDTLNNQEFDHDGAIFEVQTQNDSFDKFGEYIFNRYSKVKNIILGSIYLLVAILFFYFYLTYYIDRLKSDFSSGFVGMSYVTYSSGPKEDIGQLAVLGCLLLICVVWLTTAIVAYFHEKNRRRKFQG